MNGRSYTANVLAFTAMTGGVFFPLLAVTVTLLESGDAGSTVLTVTSPMILGALLLLLPGAVGIWLVQAGPFGRAENAAAMALVAGLALPLVSSALGLVLGSVPLGGAVGEVSFLLLFAGTVGLGLGTARHSVLAHGGTGGVLLAISMPTLVGVPPALKALGATSGSAVAVGALVATAPLGGAWLLLGYDVFARQELSIQPTKITRIRE